MDIGFWISVKRLNTLLGFKYSPFCLCIHVLFVWRIGFSQNIYKISINDDLVLIIDYKKYFFAKLPLKGSTFLFDKIFCSKNFNFCKFKMRKNDNFLFFMNKQKLFCKIIQWIDVTIKDISPFT